MIPPYSPSLPDWMRQVSTAFNSPQARRSVFANGSDFDTQLTIKEGYNPGGATDWLSGSSYSYEGLSVELGNYGPRQFGTAGTPSALNGSINIPSTSTIANHSSGVSGYARSASTTTGGVGLYGEANRAAASALIWGLNTRTQDAGFGGLTVWGAEFDINIDNVTTTAVGSTVVGASTVEPSASNAFWVQPIGIFASPKKRWQFGFRSADAGAIVGMELGAQMDAATTASQILQLNYRNASNATVTGFVAQVDSSGNALLTGGIGTTLFALKTPTSTANNIQLKGDQIGFYGATPFSKQTVTGSRGANAALASTLTALANLGLITDSST